VEKKKRTKRHKASPRRFPFKAAQAVFIGIGILLVLYLLLLQGEKISVEGDLEETVNPVPSPLEIPYPDPVWERSKKPPTERVRPTAGQLAIVIDDIGYDLSIVDDLLSLNVPITFGVLPFCPYSEQSAVRAHVAGHEVILHLPMEPHERPGKNPGDGALLTDMTDREIKARLRENLRSVPYASGVNNHMGSRFMEEGDKLFIVFSELKKRDMYFLDSLTTEHSRAKETAAAAGIKLITRDIFLDNGKNEAETLVVLQNILDKNDNWNRLILIGHPYESTTEAIRKIIPEFKKRGIELVYLSQMVEH